jgi:hypothetical protein
VNKKIANLKPWPKGVSGNPGGRPKTKPLTGEIERLLEQEAPKGKGQTWARVIAEALLTKARKGDVRAIAELANRVEGRPFQSVAVDVGAQEDLAEAIARGRQRVLANMSDDEIRGRIRQLEAQLGISASEDLQP